MQMTGDGIALVSHDFERRMVNAATVGICVGLRPNNKLYQDRVGKVSSLYLIRDVREVRSVMGSIWDADEVVRGRCKFKKLETGRKLILSF